MTAPTVTTTELVVTDVEQESAIRLLIAETLDLDIGEVTPTLRLHDVPEWSSLDHVTLMLALEQHLGRNVDGRLTARLTSVAAIEAWVSGGPESIDQGPTIQRGLDGVFVDTSAITAIDGTAGRLTIRGYDIAELAANADLTDVAHLVLIGTRPTEPERIGLTERLLRPPARPSQVDDLINRLADHHPMAVLRTAISLMGSADPEARTSSAGAAIDRGIDLAAWSIQILARLAAAATGHDESSGRSSSRRRDLAPSDRWTVANRFLADSFGTEPDPIEAEALDLVWRLQVDHGSNASAFAARVTAAAGTDVDAAVVSGLATFAGGLHGGAVQGVIQGLREIGSPEHAAAWVEDRRARRQPIMGYGHRVYKVADPRSVPLRAMAKRLADHRGDHWALDVMAAVETAMAPFERAGLGMNVDSYAAVLYSLLGFPDRFHTPLYAAARMIGWVAHVAEQVETNVLIRPRLAYTGPPPRPWSEAGGTVPAIDR